MQDLTEIPEGNPQTLKPSVDMLFSYVHDIIYKPSDASLDIDCLPAAFGDLGKGLLYLCKCITETNALAKELAVGNLNCDLPLPSNEVASSLKMLHASLKHLTWQSQQVAKGDYNQRVNFMGDFSEAFNNMVDQLEHRRKIILDEIARFELYLNLVLVNCPNPILLFDKQGKLIYVSNSFYRYCNMFDGDDILGLQIHDLFAPIVSEQSTNEIENLFDMVTIKKRMYETEQSIHFSNEGSMGHFKIQLIPMLDPDNVSDGIIVFLIDMTESIRARREAEHARELAEQSSRSKSNFLAKMSHEIRTPMNAILGMAELALRDDIPPAAQEHIHTIKQAGSNLLSIINDILDFSKIETGKLEIIPGEYLFSSLAHDVINIIRTRVLESRLRFVVNLDSNIPDSLFGDSIRIRQIILNLLSNAVKYTSSGFVSLSVKGEMIDNKTVKLTIEISDSGRGIKEEEIGRLFNEFEQLDIQQNKGIEGTGLGLAITRHLIMAMNGKINVSSEYGKGSTFTVTLTQEVRQNKRLAAVENPGKKSALVYERREISAKSIIDTMENLGVNYKHVTNDTEFYEDLVSGKYSHIFIASNIFENFKNMYPDLELNARFALITEFGEVITDRHISILTTPIFSMPVANFLNGVSDHYSNRKRQSHEAMFTAPKAKVLIVDDISTNLQVAEGLLLPYGMQVELCKTGAEAIEAIKSTHYDLVLMDQMMPEMDGIEAVSHIRALGDDAYYKGLPVVALTANAVFGTKEILLNNGFDDYLSKPIDTLKLNDILKRWLPREKQEPVKGGNGIVLSTGEAAENEIQIDGLNVKQGLAMAGGAMSKYLRTLAIFSVDGAEKVREIRICLETNNLPLYIIYVHAMKSASAIIGAGELSETAKELEQAGKQGDWDFIHAHTNVFLRDLETILGNINAVISEDSQKKSIDTELFKSLLSGLKTALIDFDSAAINTAANALQEFTQLTDIGENLKEILKNKLIGEYDNAVSLIDKLLQRLDTDS